MLEYLPLSRRNHPAYLHPLLESNILSSQIYTRFRIVPRVVQLIIYIQHTALLTTKEHYNTKVCAGKVVLGFINKLQTK